jgi:hypothetical protein
MNENIDNKITNDQVNYPIDGDLTNFAIILWAMKNFIPSKIHVLLELSREYRASFLRKDTLVSLFNLLSQNHQNMKFMYGSIKLTKNIMNNLPKELIKKITYANNNITNIIEKSKTLVFKEKNIKKIFVAGGCLTNYIFGKNQAILGDIDIWRNQSCRRYKYTENNIIFDFVRSDNKYLEECISSFDMAICQIGILMKNNIKKRSSIYVTPMFLYSYYTSKNITRIFPLVLNYMIRGMEDASINLKHIYKFHANEIKINKTKRVLDAADNRKIMDMEHSEPFNKCYLCLNDIKLRNKNSENCAAAIRWMNRVTKYEYRYSDINIEFTTENCILTANYEDENDEKYDFLCSCNYNEEKKRI